jgi:hypothetical protein
MRRAVQVVLVMLGAACILAFFSGREDRFQSQNPPLSETRVSYGFWASPWYESVERQDEAGLTKSGGIVGLSWSWPILVVGVASLVIGWRGHRRPRATGA